MQTEGEDIVEKPAKIDLSAVPYEVFEIICGRLLKAEGFSIKQSSARANDLGFDFLAIEPVNARTWAVEVKHIRRESGARADLRRTVDRLAAASKAVNADKYLLMTSAEIGNERIQLILAEHPKLDIWFRAKIEKLLNEHSDILSDLRDLLEALEGIEEQEAPDEIQDPVAQIQQRFLDLAPGLATWRDYEELCVDALVNLYVPPLNPPRLQHKTEDGLDRFDAIFSWSQAHRFWDTLGIQFNTRLIVAEFKNHTEPIGQKEVESLRDYLYRDAMRSVGLLCSRQQPSTTALKARRRAWQEARKLVLFVSDEDFAEILATKIEGGDTTQFFDDQIDHFFMDLAP